MDMGLSNRVIVVSGKANALGENIIRHLTEEGAIPVVAGRNEISAVALKREMEAIHQQYGRIEGLVNNAGQEAEIRLDPAYGKLFLENLNQELSSCYLITQAALPFLKTSRGAIININTGGQSAIAGGRNGLTREWAVDLLKYRIRVNAVLIPAEEQRKPVNFSEIGSTIAFLLSEKSSHTTGQLLFIQDHAHS